MDESSERTFVAGMPAIRKDDFSSESAQTSTPVLGGLAQSVQEKCLADTVISENSVLPTGETQSESQELLELRKAVELLSQQLLKSTLSDDAKEREISRLSAFLSLPKGEATAAAMQNYGSPRPLSSPGSKFHSPSPKCQRQKRDPLSLSAPQPECPICLLPLMSKGKAVFRTTCGHEFHFRCVKQCVLADHEGCPLCRRKFSDMTPPRTPSIRMPGFVTARIALREQLAIRHEDAEYDLGAQDTTQSQTTSATPVISRRRS